jgi:hypothetical protein
MAATMSRVVAVRAAIIANKAIVEVRDLMGEDFLGKQR